MHQADIRNDLIRRILTFARDDVDRARIFTAPTSTVLQDLDRYQLENVLNKLRRDWRELRRQLVRRGDYQELSILDTAERIHSAD